MAKRQIAGGMTHQIMVRLIGLLLFPVLLMFAESGYASTVTVRVGTVTGTAGARVDVPLQVTNGADIGAIQFDVLFDSAIAQVITVTRGAAAGANAVLEFNAAEPGRVRVGVASAEGLKGEGVLATVGLTVTGNAGQSTALAIANSRAWEKTSHLEALVKTEPGQLTVTGSLAWLLWLPVGGVCVAGLVVVAGVVAWQASRARRPGRRSRRATASTREREFSSSLAGPRHGRPDLHRSDHTRD